jgi:putative Holliday junction resolvase
VLNQGGLDYQEKALVVDKLAAAIILQGYLDKLHFMKEEETNYES